MSNSSRNLFMPVYLTR